MILKFLIAISTGLFVSVTPFKKNSLGSIWRLHCLLKKVSKSSSYFKIPDYIFFTIFIVICVVVIILSKKKGFIIFQSCLFSVITFTCSVSYGHFLSFLYSLLRTFSVSCIFEGFMFKFLNI